MNKRKCVSFGNFVKKLTKNRAQVWNNCGFKECEKYVIINQLDATGKGEAEPHKIHRTAWETMRCIFYMFRLSTPLRISKRKAMKLFMNGMNSPESIIVQISSYVAQRASMTSSG